MSDHLIRMTLECVSFQHELQPGGGRMYAACRTSAKQPLAFAFRGQSTHRQMFEVSFAKRGENELPAETWGTLSFEDGYGSFATGDGPRDRLFLVLELPPEEWHEMRDMAQRGIVPAEIFVCLQGGEAQSADGLRFNAWNPASMRERLPVKLHAITYQQPGAFIPTAVAADIVAQLP